MQWEMSANVLAMKQALRVARDARLSSGRLSALGQFGHSACIAPTGELLFRLPREGRGVVVFALGSHEFAWHPTRA